MSHLWDILRSTTQYTSEVDRFAADRLGPIDTLARASDRTSSGTRLRQQISGDCVILGGFVTDAFAGIHCYRVNPDGRRLPLICTMLGQGTLSGFGAKPTALIPPGSRVILALPPNSDIGYILGVEPYYAYDGRILLPEFVSPASRCGQAVDTVHSQVLRLKDAGGLANYNAGRPFDSLTGDWGAVTETGVAVHVDSFMAFLRAAEDTGLWAFYEDGLVRLAGQNLQIRTSGTDEERLNDEGEFSVYRGLTPYPMWEGLGFLVPGTGGAFLPTLPIDSQTGPKGPLEPANPNQIAFHRLQEFQGYLGDLERKYICSPPPGSTTWNLGERIFPVGLLEDTASVSGRKALKSARSLSLRVTHDVRVPKLLQLPQDPTGDNAENYKAAGFFGNGESHSHPDSPTNPTVDPAYPAQVADEVRAYEDIAARYPLSRHAKDYALPDPKGDARPTSFAELSTQQRMPPRPTDTIDIDHRVTSVPIAQVSAGIDVSAEGNVNIDGGFGEQIRTINGSIEVDAPGDIIFRSGRNIIFMAGQDMVVRVKGSADISTTERSIRVRAGENVQICADQGGLLFESKGADRPQDYTGTGDDVVASGIAFKSNSKTAFYSNNIYMRTLQGGQITLDADRGTGSIITQSSSFSRYLQSAASDFFGSESGGAWQSRYTNVWNPGQALIDGTVGVNGSLAVEQQVVARQGIQVLEGTVATQSGGEMGSLQGGSRNQSSDFVKTLVETAGTRAQQAAEDIYMSGISDLFYVPGGGGDDQFVNTIGFSFRSSEQMRTTGYTFYESNWQKWARLQNAGIPWIERPAVAAGQATYPYPGAMVLAGTQSYRTLNTKFVDPQTGMPVIDSSINLEDAALPSPTAVVMDGTYLTV